MERPPMITDQRINIVIMAILSKAIHMFNEIPMKNPMTFSTEIEKSILTLIWKQKKTLNSKAILSKKSNARSITISDFKLYHSNKNSMVLAQKQTRRLMEQNRIPREKSTQLQPFDLTKRAQT
jgi:hypothetical protein